MRLLLRKNGVRQFAGLGRSAAKKHLLRELGGYIRIVLVLVISILQLGERRRFDSRLAVDRLNHFVQILFVPFFKSRLVHLADFDDGGVGFQAVGESRQQLPCRLRSELFRHVLHVELALAIGHVPIQWRSRPDETEIDVIQVHQLPGGHALQEQLVPLLRPGKPFVHHR